HIAPAGGREANGSTASGLRPLDGQKSGAFQAFPRLWAAQAGCSGMRSDGKSRIYLDHNASAPLKPVVRRAMAEALELCGNPSSVHGFGRVARRAIEQARDSVAALVGAAPASVVFTSGGTEANALAIRGSGRRRVLVSAV